VVGEAQGRTHQRKQDADAHKNEIALAKAAAKEDLPGVPE
jgi:hypothetical protein